MTVSLTFLGAAGTVTGSKFLLTVDRPGAKPRRVLIDAGLFQGERKWRALNWEDPPLKLLSEIDACLLTHAHIDHCGILPRYQRLGLKCPVYCTAPTADLVRLLLRDSAILQEEEAAFRAKEDRSRHKPVLPLYTVREAEAALKLLRPAPFHKRIKLCPGISAFFVDAGHILGSASIKVLIAGLAGMEESIDFSGDIGRYASPLLRDPEELQFGSLLLIESTYGDSLHPHLDPETELARIVNDTYRRGGVLLIPAFAVGRTQALLYHFRALKEQHAIPDLPVIVDSPMAGDVTALYARYLSSYDQETLEMIKQGRQPFSFSKLYFVKDRRESMRLNEIKEPMVIISASGMLSGGRILHHLRHRIGLPQNTILFVGYQPPGSRGAWIKSGAQSLTIFKEELPIRAKVEEISAFSAHADRSELLRWCASGRGRPGKTAIVHGEPETAEKFKQALYQETGWEAFVARYGQEATL